MIFLDVFCFSRVCLQSLAQSEKHNKLEDNSSDSEDDPVDRIYAQLKDTELAPSNYVEGNLPV